MKLKKVLYLLLILSVVFAFASCDVIENTPIGDLINKLPFVNSNLKVEFNSNGGSVVDAVEVAEGEPVKAPADPTRDGYEFKGWFYNDTEWNFENPVTEDMVLVAKWEKLPEPCTHVDADDNGKCDKCDEDFEDGRDLPAPTNYNIIYMDGATRLNLTPNTYNSESTDIVLPTPAEKASYEFTGWYSDSALTNKVESIDVNGKGNVVLYAGYVPVNFKIEYVLNGGTNSDKNVTEYTVKTIPTSFAAATRGGYEFKGWFTDAELTTPFVRINPNEPGDLTLYAGWSAITYSVKFYDGTTKLDFEPTSYQISETDIALPALPEKEGVTIVGWRDADGNDYPVIVAGTYGDLVLYATYEYKVYFITYVLNGGELSADNATSYIHDKIPALNAPASRDGYLFQGWYLDADLTEAIEDLSAHVNQDITIYAKWAPYAEGDSENLTPEVPF